MEHKYILIEVSRSETTELYVKVPADFDNAKGLTSEFLKAAAKGSKLSDSDWDKSGWENDLEWQGVKNVKESDAKQFVCFDATELPKASA